MSKNSFLPFIILVLVLSISLTPAIPKSALAAVSIVTSSGQFYGPGLERILITDTSKTSATDTIQPHIDVKRGSTLLASIDPTIFAIGTSGSFEFYLTTSNAPFNPASPTFEDSINAFVGRINSSPVGNTNDFLITLPSGQFLQEGNTIVITYGGQTTTIQFAKSSVVASVDRIVAGDGDLVTLTLNDQNANIDPTNVDWFYANASILTTNVGTLNLTNARFVEEGQNNAGFDLVINLTSSTGVTTNPFDIATLKALSFPGTVTFTLHGFDVYPNVPASATAPYNVITPNPLASSSQTLTLQNTNGELTLVNPVNLSNGIQLQISDQDRNIDPKVKDTFNNLVNISVDSLGPTLVSTGFLSSIPMKETNFNSGIFLPDLSNNAIPIFSTTGNSFVNDNSSLGPVGIFVNSSILADGSNLVIQYNDPAVDPDGPRTIQLIVPLSQATPPDTEITSATYDHGKALVNGTTIKSPFVTFAFSGTSDTGIASFECKIDSGTFSACTSPVQYKVSNGAHTFLVRSVDINGQVDPTPATFSWIKNRA